MRGLGRAVDGRPVATGPASSQNRSEAPDSRDLARKFGHRRIRGIDRAIEHRRPAVLCDRHKSCRFTHSLLMLAEGRSLGGFDLYPKITRIPRTEEVFYDQVNTQGLATLTWWTATEKPPIISIKTSPYELIRWADSSTIATVRACISLFCFHKGNLPVIGSDCIHCAKTQYNETHYKKLNYPVHDYLTSRIWVNGTNKSYLCINKHIH